MLHEIGRDEADVLAERLRECQRQIQKEEVQRERQRLQYQKQKQKKFIYLIQSSGLFACVMILCIFMLFMDIEVNARKESVELLAMELTKRRKENDEAKERLIKQTEDYAWIRQEAKKLGMSYISAEQVIYYQIEDVDYMEQREEIPE